MKSLMTLPTEAPGFIIYATLPEYWNDAQSASWLNIKRICNKYYPPKICKLNINHTEQKDSKIYTPVESLNNSKQMVSAYHPAW